MVGIGTRSSVYARHGMVACSQPLASQVGLSILKNGGNAVDAAIAMAAMLALTEPCSTGIGGDAFLLFYDTKTQQVQGLNGSGRSPAKLTLEKAQADIQEPLDAKRIPSDHGHAVTVPGAVSAWVDAMENWGTKSMQEVLQPAIDYAKEGFPVHPVCAGRWKAEKFLLDRTENAKELLIDGRAPQAGEVFKNPNLASCLQEIASKGKDGYYSGPIAQAIVDMVQSKGGVMTLDDLKDHKSEFVTPIKTSFQNVQVHEIPPNGQGITALLALNLLEELFPEGTDRPEHNSSEYLHILIEALRLAFADANWYVGDTDHNDLPIEQLLSQKYAKERAALIDKTKAAIDPKHGSPVLSCDTVSFQVVDGEGNAVSMVNSNYMGFGTGFIPKGCGFTLQNRGCNFLIDNADHMNALAPRKRPYHTIIPAISTYSDSKLHATFTIMGGFMQPQGHVQLLCNLLYYGMDPQEAIDAARFCIDANRDDGGSSRVFVEDSVGVQVMEELHSRFGHEVESRSGFTQRLPFGRGQVILRNPTTGVLGAGSDGRADGCAMGW